MTRLKEIREEKKMSQERLEELSGVSRQTISKIEANPQANVKVDTIQRLADALGVNFQDIFFAPSVN